ncbi:MAG: tetratricopeptide repeat protein [Anaeromyxobacteraceae bacterium]
MRALAAVLALLVLAGAGCAHGPSRKQRESAEIHYNLGLEALRARRWPDALRELEEALKLDPEFAEAHLGRGIAYEFGYGKDPDAERDYRRAVELRPDYSEAHNDLGQLLARQGRHAEAIAEFDAALANVYYGEPYIARCNRGQALWALGKKDEGRGEIKRCLQAAPRYCAGWRGLGRLELTEGRTKPALEALGKYGELCPTVSDAWLQLGLAQMKAGDAEAAREAFRRCADLGGDDAVRDECARSAQSLQ